MGTVMERSHIALHKWLQAFHLMCSSKKGVSAHQLHRTLDIGYRAAGFLAHRIREAMRAGGLAAPMGSGAGPVEADETFIGRVKGSPRKPRGGFGHKHAVLTLVDRTTKNARSFQIAGANKNKIAARWPGPPWTSRRRIPRPARESSRARARSRDRGSPGRSRPRCGR
jgi:hypothetical protein